MQVRDPALVGQQRGERGHRPGRGLPVLIVGRPHDVLDVHVQLVVPLADYLVVGLAGASVPLVVEDGVASETVSFVVELHRAVGDV